jgi:methylenetetrahydrofolate dehydrogenase (NADP+)/methenyltetrahydrofolate cyclohydrolase
MQFIDGRKIRDEILESLKARVAALPFKPVFCDVLVGNDSASAQYVRMKNETAHSLGIEVLHAAYPDTITTEELISEVTRIAALPHMAGLIVQLPLPSHIDTQKVLDAIPLALDVDVLSSTASAQFYADAPRFIFPTAAAVLRVLESTGIELSEKKIVIIGEGRLVGKPVAHMLRAKGAEVSVITRTTEHPEKIAQSADILISAAGKAGLVTEDFVGEGAVVIDAGTSEDAGAVVGDVDSNSLQAVECTLAPVPGGVGPVTVAMLMHNLVQAAEENA